MQVDLREFRAAYLAEVEEHLAAINASLLVVEAANRAGRPSPRELREMMRLVHTIKGLSGMVGVEPIVVIAHRMENILRNADHAGGTLGDRALEALIDGTRAIEIRVRAVEAGEPVLPAAAAMIAELDALEAEHAAADPSAASGGEAQKIRDPVIDGKLTASEREQLAQGTASGRRALRVDFTPQASKAAQGLTITSVRERLAALGDLVRVLPLSAPVTDTSPGGLLFAIVFLTVAGDETVADTAGIPREDVTELMSARSLPRPAPADVPASPPSGVDPEGSVIDVQRPGVLRVDVARIDETIEQLSALIVTRSRLARVSASLRESGVDTRELDGVLADNGRQLRDLRAAILRVRMVPIGVVLDRLPLVIRGLGRSTGKQVQLALRGTGAELDKTVAERIFPALVHLLRNAVDHGIESPQERRRAGKPELATITVTSSSRNNRQIEILVEDDGRGVDRALVARKAGREVPSSDAALLELLCQPGLSTREKADTTSGRGVGMDIVRKVIVENLGGELALESTPGRGTMFLIRVPLTIAIVDSFMVRCAGQRFVVPVPVVEEIVELDPAKIVGGPHASNEKTRFFARRGETVTIADLASALGLEHEPGSSARGGAPEQALVVRRGREAPFAFAIERVLGQQETVVRPLVDPLVMVPGISGSTDLGDGRATLVLDLLGLSTKLERQKGRAA